MDERYYLSQLNNFVSKPSVPSLVFLCSQLESCFQFSGAAQSPIIKSCALKTVKAVNQTGGEYVSNENLLRIYNLVAQLSNNLGSTGIYDRLEKNGDFKKSLKFHLYWAEAHARAGNVQRFREIVEMAKARLISATLSPAQVEDGFRDIADEHLSSVSDVFHDEIEDTIYYLDVPSKPDRKSRRRSSLAVLQHDALASINPVAAVKPAPVSSKLNFDARRELVDRPDSDGYVGISIEEWRVAKLKDALFEDVDMDMSVVNQTYKASSDDMDISMDFAAPTVSMENMTSPPSTSSSSSTELLNKTPYPVASKPQKHPVKMGLSCVAEVSEDSYDFKRPRLDSSDVRSIRSSQNISTCKSTSSAALGGGSFNENVHYNAAAVFSETIDLRSAETVNDATMPVYVEPPQQFEVFVDRTLPTEIVSSESEVVAKAQIKERPKLRELSSPQVDNLSMDDIEKPHFGSKDKPITIPDIENIEAIPRDASMFFEREETLAGTRIATMSTFKPRTAFATSTPAVENWKPSQEDFFKAPEVSGDSDEDDETEEEEETAAPVSAFMRMRKSIGGAKSLQSDVKSKSSPPQPLIKGANSTMEKAMVKLSLDNSAGSSSSSSSEGVLERTGLGRPLECMAGNNPWDKDFRESIMTQKYMQKPIVLHEFKGQSPKIMKNREVELGGEIYQIHELLGQGAFARVYHCTNELGEKLAMKYEVPSCKFEVYICDQLKQRLISTNSLTASLCQKSVMEVVDGFVFQNASVLVNSFIPFGTLLDLANKMHDPSGLFILYISMQMAAILKEVHDTKVIHADVKPDNFMVQSRLNEQWTMDQLFSTPLLKLIDWGRAIDMKYLPNGTTFTGKAGTKDFDCPEMMLGLPWSYHTDYYGFVGTLCVLLSGKYCAFTNTGGKRAMNISLKRRLIGFDVFGEIINELLNIPQNGPLPSWSNIIMKLRKAFTDNFDAVEWRKAVAKFNQCLPNA